MTTVDREAFRHIEDSLRLEGFDLSADEIYAAHKSRILAGEMTPEQAKAETLVHFTGLAEHTSAGAA